MVSASPWGSICQCVRSSDPQSCLDDTEQLSDQAEVAINRMAHEATSNVRGNIRRSVIPCARGEGEPIVSCWGTKKRSSRSKSVDSTPHCSRPFDSSPPLFLFLESRARACIKAKVTRQKGETTNKRTKHRYQPRRPNPKPMSAYYVCGRLKQFGCVYKSVWV